LELPRKLRLSQQCHRNSIGFGSKSEARRTPESNAAGVCQMKSFIARSRFLVDLKGFRSWSERLASNCLCGTTNLGGIANAVTRQTSSRIGGTFSFPLKKQQAVKVSYSDGAYVRFGGNYQSVSATWQSSWIGKWK